MTNRKELPLRIGVGIILLNHANNVFVGKRIDNQKDSWQMTQGGVDENENLLDDTIYWSYDLIEDRVNNKLKNTFHSKFKG